MEPAIPRFDLGAVGMIVLGAACFLHLMFAVIAGLVARSKGRSFGGWFALGIPCGIASLLLVLCMPRRGESFGAGNILALVFIFGLPLVILPVVGILAAIAIPNFLEAQTRAKVARTRVELRNLAVNVETYYMDHKTYPPEQIFPSALTTPIAYTTYAPLDPFTKPPRDYGYITEGTGEASKYIIWGVGPDLTNEYAEIEYDITNGTTSRGDVIRHGP